MERYPQKLTSAPSCRGIGCHKQSKLSLKCKYALELWSKHLIFQEIIKYCIRKVLNTLVKRVTSCHWLFGAIFTPILGTPPNRARRERRKGRTSAGSRQIGPWGPTVHFLGADSWASWLNCTRPNLPRTHQFNSIHPVSKSSNWSTPINNGSLS